MATPAKKTPAPAQAAPKAPQVPALDTDKGYYLVNPKGCIHIVSRAHARERLKIAGWRRATKEEIAAYAQAGGFQRHDKPLSAPWVPDVEDEDDIDQAEPAAE